MRLNAKRVVVILGAQLPVCPVGDDVQDGDKAVESSTEPEAIGDEGSEDGEQVDNRGLQALPHYRAYLPTGQLSIHHAPPRSGVEPDRTERQAAEDQIAAIEDEGEAAVGLVDVLLRQVVLTEQTAAEGDKGNEKKKEDIKLQQAAIHPPHQVEHSVMADPVDTSDQHADYKAEDFGQQVAHLRSQRASLVSLNRWYSHL